MNQTVYSKIIISFLIIFWVIPLDAKLIKPSTNGEEKEILIINGKRRLYYPLIEEGLIYSVEGPTRLEFISRFPVLKKKKKSHPYNYIIVINSQDTVKVNHRYKIQRSIKSVQHPKHHYTHSGNYFINLDKGPNTIEILQGKDLKYPVMLRVLSKDFESMGKKKKVLSPMVHQNAINLITDNKKVAYFECTPSLPLKIEAKGKKRLRIMSRLEFTDRMGQEESYRIRVREGKKVLGTYYFNTERSSESQIEKKSDKVPGKWRSCEINVPKGKHTYTIEVADKGKTILTRFIVY